MLKRKIVVLCFLLLCSHFSMGQIEVDYVVAKDFKATGFGACLNFSFPVSEGDYLTIEGDLQYFKNQYDEDLALVPVLLGYRYTLDRSGAGLYVEPNAGYMFGGSSIEIEDSDNDWLSVDKQIKSPAAGINFGYIFDIGNVPFNIALRFQRSFGKYPTNVFGFRIVHSINFGGRSNY